MSADYTEHFSLQHLIKPNQALLPGVRLQLQENITGFNVEQ